MSAAFLHDIGAPALDTDSPDYDSSGSEIHLTGSGNLELEGSGPYTDVYRGDDADAPTTEKQWVCTDG